MNSHVATLMLLRQMEEFSRSEYTERTLDTLKVTVAKYVRSLKAENAFTRHIQNAVFDPLSRDDLLRTLTALELSIRGDERMIGETWDFVKDVSDSAAADAAASVGLFSNMPAASSASFDPPDVSILDEGDSARGLCISPPPLARQITVNCEGLPPTVTLHKPPTPPGKVGLHEGPHFIVLDPQVFTARPLGDEGQGAWIGWGFAYYTTVNRKKTWHGVYLCNGVDCRREFHDRIDNIVDIVRGLTKKKVMKVETQAEQTKAVADMLALVSSLY